MKGFFKRITFLLVALVAVIAAGTFGFMYLQKLAMLDAFYYTIVTIATVGYGDIVPNTVGSKILAILIILGGVGLFTVVVVNFTQYLIERRSEKTRVERLNMLVELFFSEIGNQLLRHFCASDPELDQLRAKLGLAKGNHEAELTLIQQELQNHVYKIDPTLIDFEALKALLMDNNSLLLRLLENPNLIENEAFTDVLRTTFHFRQELAARRSLTALPVTDVEHLANDAKRSYTVTAKEWVNHAIYLKKQYPYLFSLTLRTNPFGKETVPIIK